MTVFLSVCERERGGNGNSLLPMPGPYNPEGSGHTDRSLRGREEPMEHQVMARGIAGPNPCHNLRVRSPSAALGVGSHRGYLGPGRLCTKLRWEPQVARVGLLLWTRPGICPVEAAGCRTYTVLFPPCMSSLEGMPVAGGDCGLSLESQGLGPGKLVFVS